MYCCIVYNHHIYTYKIIWTIFRFCPWREEWSTIIHIFNAVGLEFKKWALFKWGGVIKYGKMTLKDESKHSLSFWGWVKLHHNIVVFLRGRGLSPSPHTAPIAMVIALCHHYHWTARKLPLTKLFHVHLRVHNEYDPSSFIIKEGFRHSSKKMKKYNRVIMSDASTKYTRAICLVKNEKKKTL